MDLDEKSGFSSIGISEANESILCYMPKAHGNVDLDGHI